MSGAREVDTSIYDEPLPVEELDALLARAYEALDGDEGRELAELIAWHRRRYPTPLERLRHATRLTRQWMRAPKMPPGEIR